MKYRMIGERMISTSDEPQRIYDQIVVLATRIESRLLRKPSVSAQDAYEVFEAKRHLGVALRQRQIALGQIIPSFTDFWS